MLSKYRVRVEHCIGEIKMRFPSFDKVPVNIKMLHWMMSLFVSKWVTAAAMIHNFAIDYDDVIMYELAVTEDDASVALRK